MTLGEISEPIPHQGEIVVAVKASSVNPVDWKVRNGEMRIITGSRFPKVYGCDLSGTVFALGPGVTGFSVGQSVYGVARIMFGKRGAHADKVAVAASRLRRMPVEVTFEQAAALPVAGLTALNGLRRCGDLNGRNVIINGATGGVGHYAVQIARARGAQVTAVCSARNFERAKSLGADRVIDYRAVDFTREGKRYDVVFDVFGRLGFSTAARALEPRGLYASTLPGPGLVIQSYLLKPFNGKHIVFANLRDKPEDYDTLEQLVTSGQVVPVIDKVFPLEQAGRAFAAQETGGIAGKVIIRIA